MSRWDAGSTLERLTPAVTIGCIVPRLRCRGELSPWPASTVPATETSAPRRVVAGYVTVKACCGPGIFPFGVTENLPGTNAPSLGSYSSNRREYAHGCVQSR